MYGLTSLAVKEKVLWINLTHNLPLSPFFNQAEVRHGFHAIRAAVEACHRVMGIESQDCPLIIFFSDKKKLFPVILPINLNSVIENIIRCYGWNSGEDYCDIFFVK